MARGAQPRIEDFLSQLDSADRERLLGELITLEMTLRSHAGKSVRPRDYRKRFAGDVPVVELALKRFQRPTFETTAQASKDGSLSAMEGRRTPAVGYQIPKTIGRYQIMEVLGRGGFAAVYLAYDTELHRKVALKVPLLDRFEDAKDLDCFVEEARAVAQFDHTGIVRVYDVQRESGLVYIVQQYIDGGHLASHMEDRRLSPREVVDLMIQVGEAVGYAHLRGCWHRDLKPANLLIDANGKPHVADFGLALHESTQRNRAGEVAGTYVYMSPEQTRGESHRLDGRSDIWSLGVIMYELLTDCRPFAGETRQLLVSEIQHRDPKPPRMVDPDVPRELSRICLTCLEKKATDRYQTAADLVDDLRHWVDTRATTRIDGTPSGDSERTSVSAQATIIPKGLRSFDSSDAEFFLQLLPGPHDRDGLPKRIRFWKTQCEKTDPEDTFPVGLMYGPSGCGKSSLVKAGLLPRLSSDLIPLYMEATADDTEAELVRRLRKQCPDLPSGLKLKQLIAHLRTSGGYRGRKVLLVLDQFEQWLHANENCEDSELVDCAAPM